MGQTLSEGGRELELRVFDKMKEKIARYGDECVIQHHQTDRGPVDILTAEFTRFGEHLDTVLGEFLFKTIPGDPEGGKYFCSVLTLSDDFLVDQVPELAFALSIINFYIEAGCFALNKPTDLLVYKNTRTFPGDTPEEVLLKDCILEMEQAYEIAAKYSTIVLALAEGSLSLEQFMPLVKG